MSASLVERMIAKLKLCPCCKAPDQSTNTPDDGIPSDCIHETVFMCGSAVFVTQQPQYRVSRACPYPLHDNLWDMEQKLSEADDAGL